MDLEEIEGLLAEVLPMRSPRFGPDVRPREKITQIEEHMLYTAHVNGALVEARHWLRAAVLTLGDQWDEVEGWSTFTSKPRERLTKADVDAAKAKARPALFEAIRKAKALRDSVDDQIIRLEREERVMSRTYTMLSGTG